MESNFVVLYMYICLSFNLVFKCDAKISIKLLQDQLRVTKESHILDLKVMHEEIDSLKERLDQIESFINDTGVIKINHSETSTAETKYQADLVRNLIDGLEKLEVVEKNFVEYAERLRNGFKSLKTWNKQSLKDLVLVLEERLGNQRQDLLSRLNMTQEQVGLCNKDIIELQKNSVWNEDKTSQALQEIKDTFTSEFQKQGASTDARFNEIQIELGKIKTTLPTYSIKMMESEWQVMFQAQAGNGASVYEAWVNDRGTTKTWPLENNRHYRNPAIDSWSKLRVKFVHLALYTEDHTEVAFILFDGIRSDKMNWFSHYRILDSSWGQLRYDSSLNHASIAGYGHRKFYINVRYGGCENDHGFMFVRDRKNTGCSYERFTNTPIFLYSEFPGGTRWHSRYYGIANYMVIKIMK